MGRKAKEEKEGSKKTGGRRVKRGGERKKRGQGGRQIERKE